MRMRRPTRTETDVVQALVQAVVDETYGGVWTDPPIKIEREDWTRGWIAVVGDAIVGVALTSEDWLDDLWVVKQARGHGVGAALLARAEREIAERGHPAAGLRVVASNTKAVAFYEHHGWTRKRRYQHEYLPVEMIEMGKRLVRQRKT